MEPFVIIYDTTIIWTSGRYFAWSVTVTVLV